MSKVNNRFKEKKIRNCGVYWVDFSGFKLPEWGNTESNGLHLSILIKSNNFAKKEMYISFPMTSNEYYFNMYGEKLVHKVILKDIVHYVLINQMRIIGKARVKNQFRLPSGEDIFISLDDLNKINEKFNNYFADKISGAIESLEAREKNNEQKNT